MENIKRSGTRRYYKYYRVNKTNPTITELSVNDFRPAGPRAAGLPVLQTGLGRFFLSTDIGQAMEKAKAWALADIQALIARGEEASPELLQYREDHYEDLNINLVDAHIQKEENAMLNDQRFAYKPYKIAAEYDQK